MTSRAGGIESDLKKTPPNCAVDDAPTVGGVWLRRTIEE